MGRAEARESKAAAIRAPTGPVEAVTEPICTEPICSLPVLGATTLEDAVFYSAVGVVSIVGWVSWPTAALIGVGHALHQRARNVVRSGAGGQVRGALIEVFDDVG